MDIVKNQDIKFKRPLLDLHKPTRIIIHCSDADAPHNALDVHHWHLQRGWSGIGYHLFIRKNGEIEEGRPLDKIGSHCFGLNHLSIGVCLEGRKEFKKIQAAKAQEVIRYLKFKLPTVWAIKPHNHYNGKKTCPNLDVEQLIEGKIKLTI